MEGSRKRSRTFKRWLRQPHISVIMITDAFPQPRETWSTLFRSKGPLCSRSMRYINNVQATLIADQKVFSRWNLPRMWWRLSSKILETWLAAMSERGHDSRRNLFVLWLRRATIKGQALRHTRQLMGGHFHWKEDLPPRLHVLLPTISPDPASLQPQHQTSNYVNPQLAEDSDLHVLRHTRPSTKPATVLNETSKRLACIGCTGHVPHAEKRQGTVLHEWFLGSSTPSSNPPLLAVSCGAHSKCRSLAGVRVDHLVLLFSHPTASLHQAQWQPYIVACPLCQCNAKELSTIPHMRSHGWRSSMVSRMARKLGLRRCSCAAQVQKRWVRVSGTSSIQPGITHRPSWASCARRRPCRNNRYDWSFATLRHQSFPAQACFAVFPRVNTYALTQSTRKITVFIGTTWSSMDKKKRSKNGHLSDTFAGICRRFRPKALFQTPKNAFLGPRSYSKGPNHALGKILTSETPRMSASWFLVSTYLIWVLESKLILSNNQSSATLWVLDTCLIVGLLPLIIILMTASLSSKMYNWDSLWDEGAFPGTHFNCDNRSTSRFPLCFGLDVFREQSPVSHLLADAGKCLFWCCLVNVTLLSPYPTNRLQKIHPFAVQHPTKWFPTL